VKSSSHEIANRYASALFDLAQAAKSVDVIDAALAELSALVNDNKDFANFTHNPLLNRAQQAQIIASISDAIKAPELVRGLLNALAEQKRLPLIENVAQIFAEKAQDLRGEMSAEIVSATALDASEQAAIAERLSKAYGKKIHLTLRTDASLLGGMVVNIKSTQLDASIAGKLNRLEVGLKVA